MFVVVVVVLSFDSALHLLITPALAYISHFYYQPPKTRGCVQFHYSSRRLQVRSACFRSALLIGWAHVSDINQLTFDWKAGCWDSSVCRKSLNCLQAGEPHLKFSFVTRARASARGRRVPRLRRRDRGRGGPGAAPGPRGAPEAGQRPPSSLPAVTLLNVSVRGGRGSTRRRNGTVGLAARLGSRRTSPPKGRSDWQGEKVNRVESPSPLANWRGFGL